MPQAIPTQPRQYATLTEQGLEELMQEPYRHPRLAVLRASQVGHYVFACGGIPGANMADAFEGDLTSLDGPEDALLPADTRKVTIRIHVVGHPLVRRTKNVQRTRRGVRLPVSRRRVVECVAEAAMLYIRQESQGADGAAPGFGPGGIELRDLYLMELYCYGRTLVPVFGYMPPNVQEDIPPSVPNALPAEDETQHLAMTMWDLLLDDTQFA